MRSTIDSSNKIYGDNYKIVLHSRWFILNKLNNIVFKVLTELTTYHHFIGQDQQVCSVFKGKGKVPLFILDNPISYLSCSP